MANRSQRGRACRNPNPSQWSPQGRAPPLPSPILSSPTAPQAAGPAAFGCSQGRVCQSLRPSRPYPRNRNRLGVMRLVITQPPGSPIPVLLAVPCHFAAKRTSLALGPVPTVAPASQNPIRFPTESVRVQMAVKTTLAGAPRWPRTSQQTDLIPEYLWGRPVLQGNR